MAIQNGRLYASALLAAKERQRVLSLVAHELKNPLGVILMGTVQALEGIDADDGRTQRRELEAIHRSAKRMKKLVGDLLDLASIDAGKLSVKPARCDVAAVITAAIADIVPLAEAAGVELTNERMPGVPSAWADGDRLGQVLVNLVSNAVKFTPRGGRVRVRCAPVDRTEIVVAVEDSGRGIAPCDLHRISRSLLASDRHGRARIGSRTGDLQVDHRAVRRSHLGAEHGRSGHHRVLHLGRPTPRSPARWGTPPRSAFRPRLRQRPERRARTHVSDACAGALLCDDRA